MVIRDFFHCCYYLLITLKFYEDPPKLFHYFGGKYIFCDAAFDVDRAINDRNPLRSDGEWVGTK